MKPYFLLSMLWFLLEIQRAFAQNFPLMAFTKDAFTQVENERQKKDLTCTILLTRSWAYAAQATYPCDIAINSCLVQGLIEEKIKATTEGAALKKLRSALAPAKDQADLQITYCQLAIESTLSGKKTLIEAAGYPSATGN
jgi:hypothetical protein